MKAGLDPNVDPALLHLYAEAVEQPIADHGSDGGSRGIRTAGGASTSTAPGSIRFSRARECTGWWLAKDRGAAHSAAAGVFGIEPAAGELFRDGGTAATHDLFFCVADHRTGKTSSARWSRPLRWSKCCKCRICIANSTQTAQLEVALQGVIVGFPARCSGRAQWNERWAM